MTKQEHDEICARVDKILRDAKKKQTEQEDKHDLTWLWLAILAFIFGFLIGYMVL